MSAKKVSRFYSKDQIVHSFEDPPRFYFCPRIELLSSGISKVVGKKIDVTEQLRPYLAKRYGGKPMPRKRAPREPQ